MRRFLALIAIGLAVGGCSRLLSSEQVSEVAKQITVLIDGCNAGSGVIFKKEGNTYSVLTAHHVVNNTTGNCLIMTPDGERYQASNQVREPIAGIDLAVLTFESSKTYKLAEWGDSEKVTVGKVVYVAGAPAPSEAIPTRTLLVTEGKVLGIVPQPFEGYAFIYNNTTNGGMSGGPMLNEDGRVIGIHGKGDKQQGIDTGRKLGIPIKMFLALNLENTRLSNIPWLNGLLFSLIHIIAIDILLVLSYSIMKIRTNDYLDLSFRERLRVWWWASVGVILCYGGLFLAFRFDAESYYNKGEYEKAINYYDKLIWINANWDFNYYYRGLAYDKLWKTHEAIDDYTQAIELNPNYAAAYYNRGRLLQNQRQAIADYNQAIQLNPKYTDVYFYRGLAYLNLGENQKAIDDCNQAIQLNPNNAAAYDNRGIAYYYLGEKQKAIADYNQAIQLDPNHSYAYYNRGLMHKDQGNKQEAIQDFQKAAELHKQQGNQQEYQNSLNRINELR